MSDWNAPTTSTVYTSVLTNLKDRDVDSATMFDVGSPTNIPTDAIKFNKASGVFQKWTGAAWSTVQLLTAALAANAITTSLIADANVTAAKLATGAAASNIGYTPANKAGDTFTGDVAISSAAPKLSLIETDQSNKTWIAYLNGTTFGIYENNTSTPRLTIAAGASELALGGSITYGGNTIWHAGNDGAASGLDADTVDGQHLGTAAAAQFASLGLGGAAGAQDMATIAKTNAANQAWTAIRATLIQSPVTLTADRVQRGVYALVQSNWTEDASGFNLNAYAVDGEVDVASSAGGTGKIDDAIGVRGAVVNQANNASNNSVTNAYALKGEVSAGQTNAVVTTAYGLHSSITRSAGAITTGYLLYGTYSGTVGTKWGVRIVGETKNQFDGDLGLGIDPTAKLHVSGAAIITSTLAVAGQISGPALGVEATPDYSFTGDLDSGFRRYAANSIALTTQAADRIKIDANGKVGVNATPSGTYQVEVSGNLSATLLYEGATALTAKYGQLGVANSWTAAQTVTIATAAAAITAVSTAAGASRGPDVLIYRNKGAGSSADLIGGVVFRAKSSTSTDRDFGIVKARIVVATNGAEYGALDFDTISNGTSATRMSLGTGLVVGSPTSGDLGAGKINAEGLSINGTAVEDLIAAGGKLVQIANTVTGAVNTGSTTIPFDDTKPQKTEGDEYMTLAFTPTNAANLLKIDIVFNGTHSNAVTRVIVALFKDADADALAVSMMELSAGGHLANVKFTHYMTAGSVSAMTFKVRAGCSASGTLTFNGQAGSRLFGGAMASSITVTEIKV